MRLSDIKKIVKMTCRGVRQEDGGIIIQPIDVQLLSPEEAYECLCEDIEALKTCECAEHDHREDIYRLEKLRKSLLPTMQETWN